MIALKEKINTVTHTKAVVMAVSGSMPGFSPLELTMIRVFCSVRIDTRASIKPMVRSSQTRLSDDTFRRLRFIQLSICPENVLLHSS